MKFTLTPNRASLVVTVDEAEREELRNWEEEHAGFQNERLCSDRAMHDFFERLTCNSELSWVRPEETGDLTDAPMLGTYTEPKEVHHNKAIVDDRRNILVGCTWDRLTVCHVKERWAFMGYQVYSVLEALRDAGEAVFIGGKL